jgi:hypothetical protein
VLGSNGSDQVVFGFGRTVPPVKDIHNPSQRLRVYFLVAAQIRIEPRHQRHQQSKDSVRARFLTPIMLFLTSVVLYYVKKGYYELTC